MDIFHGLYAKLVLVDGDNVFVGEDFARGVAHVAQVVAGNER